MNYDEWVEKYKPIKNPIEEFGFDGLLFETYGESFEFVLNQEVENVWTIIEIGPDFYLANGFHHVNRFGYVVTAIPWDADDLKENNINEILID